MPICNGKPRGLEVTFNWPAVASCRDARISAGAFLRVVGKLGGIRM